MLKKILILSFRNPFNYGAELQVFSLCKKLRILGYNAEVLNLARPYFDIDAKPSKYLKPAYYHTWKSKLKETLRFFKRRLYYTLFHKRTKLKINNSEEFHARYNNLTTERIHNFDELYSTKFSYTHYIVGSDQVWNFSYPFSLEPYFLSFVKEGKKIAYAASIGHSKIPEILKDYYKKSLQNFDIISMRETQGSTIVSELLGKPIETMLDPTLLITPKEWKDIFDITDKPNEAIIIYLRTYSPYAIDLAKRIAINNGIKKIIYISTEVTYAFHDTEIEYRFDVTAPEFVSLFANANFVITNSFHGTAFAINFGKQFFTLITSKMQTSSRFYSLMEQTGLLNRICKENTPFETIVDNPISVHEVQGKLNLLREKSLSFLQNALC